MYYKLLFIFLFSRNTVFCQDSTLIELQNVVVTANISDSDIRSTGRNIFIINQKTIEQAPVKTLDGVLQYALSVDIRSRSSAGVQADISIRGGHYDQTLIMIDGVKVNDPQTGHHSLNIPISLSQIERIEILQGGASRVFGPAAFSGLINIITKKIIKNGLGVGLGYGQYNQLVGNLSGRLISGKNSAAIYSERLSSDGYTYNTAFKKNSVSTQLGHGYSKGFVSLNLGLMDNKFGASNFYSPKFYEQYEEVSAKTAGFNWNHNFLNKLIGTLLANYRRHNDFYDFNKFRETDINSVNFHQTDVLDIEWKFKYLSAFGKSAFGLEYRIENVISNRLGEMVEAPIKVKGYEVFYTNKKNRENISGFLEQQKTIGKFNFSGGFLLNHSSQFGFTIYPGLDVSFNYNKNAFIYSSVSKSLRYPTFTELYLNTSTVLADPNLKPEQAINYEIGYKYNSRAYSTTVSTFYKKTANAIDKVKRPELPTPTMENINNINMFGVEYSGVLDLEQVLNFKLFKNISLNYAYLKADRHENGFQSFYTLNYLRHKLSAGILMAPINRLNINIIYTNKFREGTYQWDASQVPEKYIPINLLDARLSYTFNKFRIYLDVNNILDKEYFEFGFVKQPERWISGGITVDF